mmetsp:Transcript_8295/g.19844  ORF Transcript_8295/g.19844 Transcript_8295/m.19844 type:complete len:285 (-) Transcript_8295:828-1682(-)
MWCPAKVLCRLVRTPLRQAPSCHSPLLPASSWPCGCGCPPCAGRLTFAWFGPVLLQEFRHRLQGAGHQQSSCELDPAPLPRPSAPARFRVSRFRQQPTKLLLPSAAPSRHLSFSSLPSELVRVARPLQLQGCSRPLPSEPAPGPAFSAHHSTCAPVAHPLQLQECFRQWPSAPSPGLAFFARKSTYAPVVRSLQLQECSQQWPSVRARGLAVSAQTQTCSMCAPVARLLQLQECSWPLPSALAPYLASSAPQQAHAPTGRLQQQQACFLPSSCESSRSGWPLAE